MRVGTDVRVETAQTLTVHKAREYTGAGERGEVLVESGLPDVALMFAQKALQLVNGRVDPHRAQKSDDPATGWGGAQVGCTEESDHIGRLPIDIGVGPGGCRDVATVLLVCV